VGPGASLREQAGQVTAGEAVAQPLLLFLDDRDGLGIDEDGVRRCVDFALAVSEAGDGVSFRGIDGAARGRGQAVEGTQADLAGSPAGEDLQQQHPHQLRVARIFTRRDHPPDVMAYYRILRDSAGQPAGLCRLLTGGSGHASKHRANIRDHSGRCVV